jgi:O-antigen/teichoic acid export membrane protein
MYVSVTNTAFLQSMLKFQFLSFTITLGGVLKLVMSIGLLFAGFGIMGILWGYFLAFLIPLLITFIPLKSLFLKGLKGKTKIHKKEIFTYGLPATIAVFSLSSFTSTDILLVKHFFPSSTAALYSGLSLVGRIIFYFSAPIATVMFPLVTKKFHSGENPKNLLYASFLLVLIPSLFLSILYFLYPNLIISLVLGKRYFAVAGYLGWFGLYLSIFSLLNISVNFLLSIKKTSVSYVIAAGAVLQVIGISLFHANIASIIAISLILSLVLFIALLLYYQKTYGSQQNQTK